MIEQAKDLNDLSVPERIIELSIIAREVWGDNVILQNIAVGQAILESGIRKDRISGLAMQNNLFGIKGSGTKGIINMDTKEQDHAGNEYNTRAEFASNRTLRDSFEQHHKLLHKPRYRPVLLSPTLDIACQQIVKCGYATDKTYADKLFSVINSIPE